MARRRSIASATSADAIAAATVAASAEGTTAEAAGVIANAAATVRPPRDARSALKKSDQRLPGS